VPASAATGKSKTTPVQAAKPAVETVKIPVPQHQEKPKEENLPKVDENLKKKQPGAGMMNETTKKGEKKPASLSDHTSN
jgi:hypothetical protein